MQILKKEGHQSRDALLLYDIPILTSWYTDALDVLWHDGAKKLSKVTPYNEDNAMYCRQ